jgi:predicted Zn-dependent protease
MRARVVLAGVLALGVAAPIGAAAGRVPQLGRLGQAKDLLQKGARAYQDLKFTEAEEQQLGADISAKLRDKYGVAQDAAVHRYVTLVGSVLAQASTRPNLRWTFVVLDTDGVNAFAAPGGFIHITRGALALIRNEAELADVLGHEMGHVTAQHTINAIRKTKVTGALAGAATRNEFLKEVANRGYAMVVENKFDRNEEMDADKTGVVLANKVGYAPTGLGAFLTRLADRNKGLKERSGVFASHPETKARLDGLTKIISSQKLASAAMVQPRYTQSVSYKPVAVDQLAQAGPAAVAEKPQAGATGGSGKYGVGGLGALGGEKAGSSTVASAGSRGVNPDRDARGGPNKALVVVTVTAADVAQFRKGIA